MIARQEKLSLLYDTTIKSREPQERQVLQVLIGAKYKTMYELPFNCNILLLRRM